MPGSRWEPVRLAALELRDTGTKVIAANLGSDRGDLLVDLRRAYASYVADRGPGGVTEAELARSVPTSIIDLILPTGPGLRAAKSALEYVESHFDDVSFRAKLEADGVFVEPDSVRYLPPISRPGKVICIGANYKSHIAEVTSIILDRPPAVPMIEGLPAIMGFAKFPSSLVGNREAVPYPLHTHQLDYEVELALVIGRRCKGVAVAEALDYVAGYSIFNDISLRDLQFREMEHGFLLLGKNCDGAAPIGPYLVTSDEIPDPQRLQLSLMVNGEMRQQDSTSNMLASCAEIVAYWSHVTLEPGDIIATGTPAGVGIFRDEPERYLLKVGDVIEAHIERLGTLSNHVANAVEVG